jgi:hypothetical protein
MDCSLQACEAEFMAKLTILCHPYTPVPSADLEKWLHSELDQLRSAAPQAIIRLSQLSQDLPDRQIETGWLIELEAEEDSLFDHHHLAQAITDMCSPHDEWLIPAAGQA